MLRKKLSFHSLKNPKDLFWLCLGASLGLANIFLVPDLVIQARSIVPLVIYFVFLFIFALPVMYGEILWGRWFQRSIYQSFHALGPVWAYVATSSSVAVFLILPILLKDISGIAWLFKTQLANKGQMPSGALRNLEPEPLLLAVTMFVIWNLALGALALSTKNLVRIFKALAGFVFLSALLLLVASFDLLSSRGLMNFFSWDTSRVGVNEVFSAMALSLVSVMGGLGVYQNFTVHSCALSFAGSEEDQRHWKRPGEVIFMISLIAFCNMLLGLMTFLLLSPFSDSLMRFSSSEVHLELVLFEWLPQIWGQAKFGSVLISLWLLLLGAAGALTVMSLLEFLVFQVESTLKWSRRKILFHFSLGSTGLFLLSLVPNVYRQMWYLGLGIFWPSFTLFFSIWVGWKMPLIAQRRILGRSLFLDQLSIVLYGALKFVVPVLSAAMLLWGVLNLI